MTLLSKRQLLIALTALAASSGHATSAWAQETCVTPDLPAGREIGAAWRAANPNADLSALRADLLRKASCEEALAHLRARARADFRSGWIFIYRGWRLSETEAQLFAATTQH